jgi:flagellar basal-body rod protein FlgB
MPVEGLFNTTVGILSKSLDLRTRNHNQISANIANAETPGFTPSTLSFEGELQGALKGKGNRGMESPPAHPRHIPLKTGGGGLEGVRGKVVESPASTAGPDGNGVELENEMAKMVENQIMYNASVQLLGRKFQGLKDAIKGGP